MPIPALPSMSDGFGPAVGTPHGHDPFAAYLSMNESQLRSPARRAGKTRMLSDLTSPWMAAAGDPGFPQAIERLTKLVLRLENAESLVVRRADGRQQARPSSFNDLFGFRTS